MTAVAWLVIALSTVVVTLFVLRVSTFAAYEMTSISLLAWWFVLGVLPLYFLSGLFMLRGKHRARQLCVAIGASCVLLAVLALPFSALVAGPVLLFALATALLYRPAANRFFLRPKDAPIRLGPIALLVGAFAAGMAATVIYLQSLFSPVSQSLEWLAKMGVVRHSPASQGSVTQATVFAINDGNAMLLLTSLAIFLAAAAIVLALIAEYRREPTLYLSAGYTCGVPAIALFKPLFAFAAAAAGILAVVVMRHDRRTRDDAF